MHRAKKKDRKQAWKGVYIQSQAERKVSEEKTQQDKECGFCYEISTPLPADAPLYFMEARGDGSRVAYACEDCIKRLELELF